MKYAVVTGGTSGMGLGVAKMLIQKGYYVFTTYVGLNSQIRLRTMRPIWLTRQNEKRYMLLSNM